MPMMNDALQHWQNAEVSADYDEDLIEVSMGDGRFFLPSGGLSHTSLTRSLDDDAGGGVWSWAFSDEAQ